MKYLIDIPHPHFVHFFKNLIKRIGEENVVITCQDSGIITELLKENQLEYIIVGKKYNSLFSKAIGQIKYFLKYLRIIKSKNINAVLGMSPAVMLAARVLRKKVFFFDDDDSAVQPLTKKITIPLADVIITPKCLAFENYGSKHLVYSGYQELAYLSPKYFNPDNSIIEHYGLVSGTYFVLRFNDFVAHHDVGHSGIPEEIKERLVNLLNKYGKVFITSESPLTKEYQQYQLKVKSKDIHHILAFAKMYIGDSQTMASEAAVLGTPSIRCNTFKGKIAYLSELESTFALTYAFLPSEGEAMNNKIQNILMDKETPKKWIDKKGAMLEKMEDVNDFIINAIK